MKDIYAWEQCILDAVTQATHYDHEPLNDLAKRLYHGEKLLHYIEDLQRHAHDLTKDDRP